MNTETPDYGEPWRDQMGTVRDRMEYFVSMASPETRDRIIACVNACQGMPDPSAEIEAMREAMQTAYEALDNCVEFIQAAHIIEAPWDWEPVKQTRAALAKLQPFVKP